ncbi:MAG TPA: 50S ribosomal protein L30e [Candidatus Diapherotrites archaeon]|uniref:Large ribosomal subunit protein eL30 n=1 Tax=Candidatus Iainarchaeum sp. TaxID=3101447 RepID=A0A7J4IYJ7_9ARCH|nr:50S ribosomal protein L30e [Candidatus Diapherotrites archaeon]
MDVAKEIRRAVDTGKVIFGTKESERSLKNGSAKLIIVALNAPKLNTEKLSLFASIAKTPVHNFSGTGLELGSVCGKPFTVSAMTIEDAGKSKVLEIEARDGT